VATYIKSCDSCAATLPCGGTPPDSIGLVFEYDLSGSFIYMQSTLWPCSSSDHCNYSIGECLGNAYYGLPSPTPTSEPPFYSGLSYDGLRASHEAGLWTSSVNIYVRADAYNQPASLSISDGTNAITITGLVISTNHNPWEPDETCSNGTPFGIITVYSTPQADGKYFSFQFA